MLPHVTKRWRIMKGLNLSDVIALGVENAITGY
jgi:hypothetical protein